MTLDTMADVLANTDTRLATLEQHYHDLTTRLDAPQIAQAVLADLELDDQITCLMNAERPAQWCTPTAIRCLAAAWPDARQRLLLATAARRCGVMPAMLAGLVEQWHGEAPVDGTGLATVNGMTLLQTDYTARQDVIPDVLPAGCTLLAGNAKDGKSLLAYHLAACVATGTPFLGQFPVVQGEVLFFALEDGERRGKERLDRQREQLGVDPEAFANIHFRFWDAPKLGLGFERELEAWMATHPETRLIVIDILEKIRPPRAEFADLYRTGYASTAPLTRVAQEQNVALLVVHHTNKNPHSDPRLLVSGPMSVLGGADNAWLLRRAYGETEAELIIAGRDIPEQEWALHFADGLWSLEGTLGECRMSRERREVLEVLQDERTGMKPYQLALAMGKKAASIRSLLRKMRDEGQVAVNEEGLYTALVRPRATPEESVVIGPWSLAKDKGLWTKDSTGIARGPVTLPGIAGGGVHGVHGVHDVSSSLARVHEAEACTPPAEEEPMHTEHTDHTVHAMHADHTGNGVHSDNGEHADHTVHADHAVHTDHAMHTEHAMHAVHAGNGDHNGNAVHTDNGDHAEHAMHTVHAPPEEDDPFLTPEQYPPGPLSMIIGPLPGTEDAGQRTPAQVSTPAQESTALPEELPIREGDWIWACLPTGSRTNQTPWQVIDIHHLPNGITMIYGQSPTGRLIPWRLEHCRRAPQPDDAP